MYMYGHDGLPLYLLVIYFNHHFQNCWFDTSTLRGLSLWISYSFLSSRFTCKVIRDREILAKLTSLYSIIASLFTFVILLPSSSLISIILSFRQR
jgi:hypothetical protein